MPSLPSVLPLILGGDPDEVSGTPREFNRLATYIKDKPNMLALLETFGTQIDEITDALAQLGDDRLLADAFGAQLDVFGAIVGQERTGVDDDTYRARIQARIKLNKCSGTVDEILTILGLIKPAGTTLELRDYTAGFVLFLGELEVPAADSARVLYFLRLARAAGVRGIMHYLGSDIGLSFTFDGTSSQAFDAGAFAGAAV